MKESVTYQAILDEGRVEGRVEGEARGLLKGEKLLLLRLGRKRFGPPEPSVVAAIEALTDPRQVEQLGDRLIDASSWAELLASP